MSEDTMTQARAPEGRRHEKYERLVEAARQLPPTKTAIVHPCDLVSLESAIEAAKLGLIEPILVGPTARIHAVALREGLDIAALPLVDTEHSHESAAKAVERA